MVTLIFLYAISEVTYAFRWSKHTFSEIKIDFKNISFYYFFYLRLRLGDTNGCSDVVPQLLTTYHIQIHTSVSPKQSLKSKKVIEENVLEINFYFRKIMFGPSKCVSYLRNSIQKK